jgi:hypothetical protein
VTILFAIALLAGAAWFLQRRWEDQPIIGKRSVSLTTKPPMEKRKRNTLLDRNPGEWLAARHAMGAVGQTLFLLLTLGFSVFAAFVANSFRGMGSGGRFAAIMALALGTLLILVRLASQASYSLAEARRSGAIEILISTPLHPKCLITGQIASLTRQFLPPLGMLLIASGVILSYEHGPLEFAGSMLIIGIFWGAVTLVTTTVAAFGMWMGLREKSPNAAFSKTLAFTILPLIVGWCLWFALPIGYVILLLVSIAQLTGRDLQRLVRNEKKLREMTPITPIVAAPPVIKS